MQRLRVVWLAAMFLATAMACSDPATDTIVGCPMAVIEGVLVMHDRETAVQAGPDRTRIIWPLGYTLQSNGGPWEVHSEMGNTVATVGRIVHIRGGFITGDDHWTACGPPLDGK